MMTDYLEGALSASQRNRFEEHLALGDPCVEYLGQIRTTIALANQLVPEPVDLETKERLVRLYRSWQRPAD